MPENDEQAPPPAKTPSGWRRFLDIHSHPALVGISAVATLLLTVIIWRFPTSAEESGPAAAKPATAASASASGSPSSAAAEPIVISPARHVRIYTLGDSHVLAENLSLTQVDLDQLNALDGRSAQYDAWFADRHAIDPYQTELQIVVEGARDHPVRIVDIEPVTTCTAPLDGTLFFAPSSGGDNSTKLLFDLDNPQAAPGFTEDDHSGKDYFGSHTVSLKLGEQFTFNISASTQRQYCEFTIDVTVLDGSQKVVMHVTDQRQKFRVTGIGAYSSYKALYIGGIASVVLGGPDAGKWRKADPLTYHR